MRIAMLGLADLDPFIEHLGRQMAESGRPGSPIFTVYGQDEEWDAAARRDATRARWEKPLTEPGWERAWGAYDGETLVGHLDLKCRPLKTALHRGVIGLGVYASHRRRGGGRALLTTAIAWAREQPSLDWLDLNVFVHNVDARRLYDTLGFVQCGIVTDLFRIDGQSVHDVEMTLPLRASR